MVLIQKLPEELNTWETFENISNHILNKIAKNTLRCVWLVKDQHNPASKKSLEREAGPSSGQIRTTPRKRKQKVPR